MSREKRNGKTRKKMDGGNEGQKKKEKVREEKKFANSRKEENKI